MNFITRDVSSSLIAEGEAIGLDKEIAATLIIVKRTVDTHVAHILAKLGFSSRAQIAAWVASRPRES